MTESFTPDEKNRIVEHLIGRTIQMIIAQSIGMTPEEAQSYGAFDESAFSSMEKDKLFEDFSNDCFHPSQKQGVDYE